VRKDVGCLRLLINYCVGQEVYKQVVKVILQKGHIAAAHDGSIVFASWSQCAPPSNTCFFGPTPESTSKTTARSVSQFLHSSRQTVPISLLYNGPLLPPPLKTAYLRGDLDLHLIHGSLGPPESTTQTACRSVQPFLLGSRSWQTGRRTTDHAIRSVTMGRIYVGLHSTAMRPNNGVVNCWKNIMNIR